MAATWTLDNLAPPVFPFASAWKRAADAAIPPSLAARLHEYAFEPTAADMHLGEIQVEELHGPGVWHDNPAWAECVGGGHGTPRPRIDRTLLSAATWWCGVALPRALGEPASVDGGNVRGRRRPIPRLLLSVAEPGPVAEPRPGASGPAHLVAFLGAFYRAGWRPCSWSASPARPLWPTGWLIRHYGPRLRSNKLAVVAIRDAYQTKGKRAEVFAPLIAALPPGVSVLGYLRRRVTRRFPSGSLWAGAAIVHVRLNNSGDKMRQRGVKYVLLIAEKLTESPGRNGCEKTPGS